MAVTIILRKKNPLLPLVEKELLNPSGAHEFTPIFVGF
jgi:hypothetical protein